MDAGNLARGKQNQGKHQSLQIHVTSASAQLIDSLGTRQVDDSIPDYQSVDCLPYTLSLFTFSTLPLLPTPTTFDSSLLPFFHLVSTFYHSPHKRRFRPNTLHLLYFISSFYYFQLVTNLHFLYHNNCSYLDTRPSLLLILWIRIVLCITQARERSLLPTRVFHIA